MDFSFLTEQLSEQVQYINMILSVLAIIFSHIVVRRSSRHVYFLLPMMIYFYELLVFYFTRIVVTNLGHYDIVVFTAISSLIRLQFSASMAVVLGYMVFREYKRGAK